MAPISMSVTAQIRITAAYPPLPPGLGSKSRSPQRDQRVPRANRSVVENFSAIRAGEGPDEHPCRTAALLTRRDRTMLTITVVATAAAGVLHFADMNAVVAFVVAALALATLASLVGRSVEALGDRLGPNATGILQTALGNLPELFVIMFALKAGLFGVVKATIVGSILSNALLVLGLAFVVGGLKHGRQRFAADDVRTLGLMFTLAVFILAIPSLTAALHTPAQ